MLPATKFIENSPNSCCKKTLLCFPHGKGVDHVVPGIAHGHRLAGRAGKAIPAVGRML